MEFSLQLLYIVRAVLSQSWLWRVLNVPEILRQMYMTTTFVTYTLYIHKLEVGSQHSFSTSGNKALPESSSSSQGISLKGWAVWVDNDVASDSRCRATCLFQASGFLLYFEKSIKSEVWYFLVFPTQIYCLQKSLLSYKQSSCFSDSLRIGFTVIYFLLCVLYLTCDYTVTHATFLSLFLIFLNPVCP